METEKILSRAKNQIQHRTLQISKELVDEERRTIKISFSSNSEIEHWFGFLTLDHKLSSVRLGRLNTGGALLWNHNTDDQFGVIESVYVDENAGKGYAEIRFSKSARGEEMYQDVLDGIRTNVSVAFMIHELHLEKEEEEIKYYRSNDWEPMEISLVSVPADITVGVGRSIAEAKKELGELKSQIEELKKVEIINQSSIIKDNKMEKLEQEKLEKEIQENERNRVNEILAIAKRHNLDPSEAIKNGTSIEAYRGIVLEKIGNEKPLYNDPFQMELSEGEKKEYNLVRAITSLIPGSANFEKKSFEREISDNISKESGRNAKGIFIPYDAIKSGTKDKILKRDLTAGGSTTGAEWVVKEWRGSEFIDLLRNKMLLAKYGARIWSGLSGNVYVPKLSAGVTYGWRSTENAALGESTPTTGQLLLTPKSGGTYVDISKALLFQSLPAADQIVSNDLLLACALGLDAAGLHGSGSSGQPRGIADTSGIGSVAGASYTYLKLLEHQTDVEAANADVPSMAYISTPAIRGTLKSREKVSGYPSFICEANNQAGGYPFDVTNQVSSGYIFFGDYSQVIFALWSGIDLTVDNLTLATQGLIRIVADQFVDIGVRQAGAFSVASSFS